MELSPRLSGVCAAGVTAIAPDVRGLRFAFAVGAAVFAALLGRTKTTRMSALFEIGCHTWFPLSIGSSKWPFRYIAPITCVAHALFSCRVETHLDTGAVRAGAMTVEFSEEASW